MTKANECTCPSGDGSLRHPCPAHPAAEQAGGDERDLQGAQGERECGHAACKSLGEHHPFCKFVSDQDRAALAQPSPASDLDPLNLAPHAEAFNEAPAEALKPEQAEAERPKIVATLFTPNEKVHDDIGFKAFAVSGDCDKDGGEFYDPEKLMTVAQHERITAQLHDALDESDGDRWKLRSERDAANARLHEVAVACATAEQERDAALARVAELEKQEPVALANRGIHAFWVKWTEAAAGLYGHGIKLYAHPVAQAQHSVPEGVTIERDVAGTIHIKVGDFDFIQLQYQRPYTDNASTWKLAERIASLLAAAPGKEVGHE
ncbi:hypothetical protein L5E49_05230 [Pseudomonas aeruginosa]|nr:hypothetical protein [Pseudomonas aeruginosa]